MTHERPASNAVSDIITNLLATCWDLYFEKKMSFHERKEFNKRATKAMDAAKDFLDDQLRASAKAVADGDLSKGALPAGVGEAPANTPAASKRITEGVRDMLAIIEDPTATEDEKAAAANTIVEAVAPDIMSAAVLGLLGEREAPIEGSDFERVRAARPRRAKMSRTIDGFEFNWGTRATLYRVGGEAVIGDIHHFGSEHGVAIGDGLPSNSTLVCRLYKDRALAINVRILDLYEQIAELEDMLMEDATSQAVTASPPSPNNNQEKP